MDRGAWQAIVYWVARAGYNLATKSPPTSTFESFKILLNDDYSNILLRRDLTTFVKNQFHSGVCRASDPGEGNGNPVQYSCLENPMDRA